MEIGWIGSDQIDEILKWKGFWSDGMEFQTDDNRIGKDVSKLAVRSGGVYKWENQEGCYGNE